MAMKIMIGINSAAGFIFLSSFLITTFQQYQSYMDAQEFQKEFSLGEGVTDVPEPKAIKKRKGGLK